MPFHDQYHNQFQYRYQMIQLNNMIFLQHLQHLFRLKCIQKLSFVNSYYFQNRKYYRIYKTIKILNLIFTSFTLLDHNLNALLPKRCGCCIGGISSIHLLNIVRRFNTCATCQFSASPKFLSDFRQPRLKNWDFFV